jgi:DNA-binding transcriptional MerR regulator
MLKIGDFSRLSQVSVKTLRYYDEVGLLKPAQVDQLSGYRYVTEIQVPIAKSEPAPAGERQIAVSL